MIFGRSPLRVSFAGGGTDLEEYHNKHIGHTVTFTINKYTYVVAKTRTDSKFQGFSPDFASHQPPRRIHKIEPIQGHEIIVAILKELNFKKGLDIFFCSDVGPGSGLGASSSLASNLVNVITQLKGVSWSKQQIANKAYQIGHDLLKWNIGKQDEFSSVHGGLNLLSFTKGKVEVKPIIISRTVENELQNNSLLFYLGPRKSSHEILRSQADNIKKSNKQTMAALHKAKELALEVYDSLIAGDLTKFGYLINKGWEQKKKFTNNITDSRIDSVINLALNNGALGIKITGAGGGGHLYAYADKSKHKSIIYSLKKAGVKHVDFKYQHQGITAIDTDIL